MCIRDRSIVIAGNKPGPSKMLRAKDLGLTPISFEEFINLYEIKIENWKNLLISADKDF